MPPPCLLRVGAQRADLFDQRMSHIAAGRSPEPGEGRRLEGQQRQHVIDVGAHRPRAPRPPSPDRRADIVHDRDCRGSRPHHARDAVGEIRAVDDDEHVRPVCHDGIRRRAHGADEFRQVPDQPAETDEGEGLDRCQRRQPFRRHFAAADADTSHRAGRARGERTHQSRAEAVARLFGRNQKNGERNGSAICCCHRLPAHRVLPSAGTPTTNKPARSAACATCAGSAMIAPPATTARPASPARATPSMVCGPMLGRSKRRS